MLAKLEQAIQELEEQLNNLIEDVQKYGWKDERRLERIPESQEPAWDILDYVGEVRTVPEKAPLPPNASRIYQRWYSSARALIARNQPNRLKEFDEDYSSISDTLSSSHVTEFEQFHLLDRLNHN